MYEAKLDVNVPVMSHFLWAICWSSHVCFHKPRNLPELGLKSAIWIHVDCSMLCSVISPIFSCCIWNNCGQPQNIFKVQNCTHYLKVWMQFDVKQLWESFLSTCILSSHTFPQTGSWTTRLAYSGDPRGIFQNSYVISFKKGSSVYNFSFFLTIHP